VKCSDQSNERSIKFSVHKMGASAHPRTSTVGVVRSSGSFGVLEIAFDKKGLGVFEVGLVEVGGPCILCNRQNCAWRAER